MSKLLVYGLTKLVPMLVYVFVIPGILGDDYIGLEVAQVVTYLPIILLGDLGFSQEVILKKSTNNAPYFFERLILISTIGLIIGFIISFYFSLNRPLIKTHWFVSVLITNFCSSVLLTKKKFVGLLIFTISITFFRWVFPFWLFQNHFFELSSAVPAVLALIMFILLSEKSFKINGLRYLINSLLSNPFTITAFLGAYWTVIDRHLIRYNRNEDFLTYTSTYSIWSALVLISAAVAQYIEVSGGHKVVQIFTRKSNLLLVCATSLILAVFMFNYGGYLSIIPMLLNILYSLQTLLFFHVVHDALIKKIIWSLPLVALLHLLLSFFSYQAAIVVQICIHGTFLILMYVRFLSFNSIANKG